MWDFGSVWYKKLQKTMKKSFVLSQNFKPVGYRKSLITIKKAFPRVFPLDMLTFVLRQLRTSLGLHSVEAGSLFWFKFLANGVNPISSNFLMKCYTTLLSGIFNHTKL